MAWQSLEKLSITYVNEETQLLLYTVYNFKAFRESQARKSPSCQWDVPSVMTSMGNMLSTGRELTPLAGDIVFS